MKVNTFVILVAVTIILSVFLTSFVYNLLSYNVKVFYKDIKIKEIEMDLNVTGEKKGYGINIDTDAIHFGKLPLGAGSTRHMNITNYHDFSTFFYIKVEDNLLSKIVSISPNYFVLKPNENKLINIAVSVPKDSKPGNYEGKLDVMIRVPFFRAKEAETAIS